MEKKVVGLSELVPKAAEQAGISKKRAEIFTKALKEAIAAEIKAGNDFTITGLVVFKHHHAAERTFHMQGKTTTVPAHDVVHARASRKLYK